MLEEERMECTLKTFVISLPILYLCRCGTSHINKWMKSSYHSMNSMESVLAEILPISAWLARGLGRVDNTHPRWHSTRL